MKKTIALFIVTTLLFSLNVQAQNKADDIVGIWLTCGKEPAKIQVYKVSERFPGKIISLKNPTENGKQRLDNNDPDKEKQSNPQNNDLTNCISGDNCLHLTVFLR